MQLEAVLLHLPQVPLLLLLVFHSLQPSGHQLQLVPLRFPFVTPNSNNGGANVSQCTATSNPGSLTASTLGAGVSPITMTGLAQNTSYTFTVTCTNAIGQSAASAVSNLITTWTVPTAPSIGSAIAESAFTATVPFTLNSNGGTSITSCIATSAPGSCTGSSMNGSSPITVSGLHAATSYTFTVNCFNVIGSSSQSAASNVIVTLPAVPDVPSIGTALATSSTNATVTLNINSNNGSPIIYCTAITSPENHTANNSDGPTFSPITITGLTPGIAHRFRVTCTNTVGTSAESKSISYCKRCCTNINAVRC